MQKIRQGKRVESRLHISGHVYPSMVSPLWTLNIHEWFVKDSVEQPGLKRVVLCFKYQDKLGQIEHMMR